MEELVLQVARCLHQQDDAQIMRDASMVHFLQSTCGACGIFGAAALRKHAFRMRIRVIQRNTRGRMTATNILATSHGQSGRPFVRSSPLKRSGWTLGFWVMAGGNRPHWVRISDYSEILMDFVEMDSEIRLGKVLKGMNATKHPESGRHGL